MMIAWGWLLLAVSGGFVIGTITGFLVMWALTAISREPDDYGNYH